jgi:hypothetical protein
MNVGSGPLPVPASVLFLRLRGLGEDLPSEQKGRRERLAATVKAALIPWDSERRVVLEGPDGLAIVGEVEPAAALESARIAAGHGGGGRVGIGLHYGPVCAIRRDGHTHIVGDGIETAAALAGFGAGHPIVASQSFRAALALRSPRQAEELRPAGEQVDERLRSHSLYVFDPDPARQQATRRNVVALSGILVLLGTGWAARVTRERYEEARRPAVIVLDIKPSGELFVDGEAKGSTPPLVRLSLPAGPHMIEVRSGRARPLQMQVTLQPGEQMQLKHVFAAPPAPRRPRPQPQKEQPGLLERFRFW